MSRSLVLLICLAGLLTTSASQAAITLTQADGENLHLEHQAQRIVTLSPNLAELVFAAGAGERLVATVEYSNFPEQVASLPRVGDAFRLDIEGIVALRPDLAFAWDSGNPRPAVAQLRSLGITVWSVEIREPGQIATTLEAIGRAAGTRDTANEAALDFRTRLEALSREYRDASPLTYFYQADARPLFTLNGDHLVSRGLALCGAENLFADEAALAFQVSHEAVVVADPDALIAPMLPGGADPLAQWRTWPAMKAVESGSLFTLDADRISRATPRWLESIETGCRLLQQLRQQD